MSDELWCFGRVSSPCSTSGNRCLSCNLWTAPLGGLNLLQIAQNQLNTFLNNFIKRLFLLI